MNKNKAFVLKDGDIAEEVDTLRLTIGAGPAAPGMRRSGVWKFSSRRKDTDFFVTSQAIQGEMKGTVHRTRAHFGFSDPANTTPEAWVGPPLENRHYHILAIRDLQPGDYQHVMRVGFPGFALLAVPQPLKPRKRVLEIDPPAPDAEVTFGVTAVEGDWRAFSDPPNGQYVGLLTGDSDRYALISVTRVAYDDAGAVMQNMKRNLGLINAHDRPIPDEDLSVLLWMNREDDQPITIIELNGVRSQRA